MLEYWRNCMYSMCNVSPAGGFIDRLEAETVPIESAMENLMDSSSVADLVNLMMTTHRLHVILNGFADVSLLLPMF